MTGMISHILVPLIFAAASVPACADDLRETGPAVVLRVVPGLEEPLIPTAATTAQEDADLEAAIAAFARRPIQSADFTDSAGYFNAFLDAHPTSAWRLAVLTNLGLGYYRAGYFTRAAQAWADAWHAGRGAEAPQARALADRAVGELARMHARVGNAGALETLFAEIGARQVSGPATEMIAGAREGLWMFRNDWGKAYLCGPMALKNLLIALKADPAIIERLDEVRSGPQGFTFEQVARLAVDVGQRHALVYRAPGQAIPVPSIVHWKMHHYAAIVEEREGHYRIQDPTFGSGDMWVSKAAIDAESSGHFLVPAGVETDARWRLVDADAARQVYGMGATANNQPGATTPDDEGLNNDPDCGMCVVNAKTMVVSLNLNDTPVGYQPPKGPAVRIRLSYHQREASQPANFGFFNVGPKWTMNLLSWVQDNPNDAGRSVMRHVAGGGAIDYSTNSYSFAPDTGEFSPERQSAAVLVRIPASGAVTAYELRMPDGSKQIFSKADGATSTPRRVFLTQIVDPSGNALTLH